MCRWIAASMCTIFAGTSKPPNERGTRWWPSMLLILGNLCWWTFCCTWCIETSRHRGSKVDALVSNCLPGRAGSCRHLCVSWYPFFVNMNSTLQAFVPVTFDLHQKVGSAYLSAHMGRCCVITNASRFLHSCGFGHTWRARWWNAVPFQSNGEHAPSFACRTDKQELLSSWRWIAGWEYVPFGAQKHHSDHTWAVVGNGRSLLTFVEAVAGWAVRPDYSFHCLCRLTPKSFPQCVQFTV